MAYEFRDILDYKFGQLSSPATISDTTLACADFAGLPTLYTTGIVLPLVLHDPALKLYEVVWVTGHVAASTSVTVVRGREGTTAKAWGGGTQVLCSPTVRDGLTLTTRAALPTDVHIGARFTLSDEQITVERVPGAWGPSVGVAQPAQVGPRRSGVAISNNAIPLLRGGYKAGVTTSGGKLTVTHAAAFANDTIATTVALVDADVSCVPAVFSETAGGVVFVFYKTSDGLPIASGLNVKLQYISMGF